MAKYKVSKKKAPEGKHMMPDGHMMPDSEMKKKMKKKKMMNEKGHSSKWF